MVSTQIDRVLKQVVHLVEKAGIYICKGQETVFRNPSPLRKTNKAQSYKISHPKLHFCQNINIQRDTQEPGLQKKWLGHTNDDNISKLAKSSTWRLFSVTMLKKRMKIALGLGRLIMAIFVSLINLKVD